MSSTVSQTIIVSGEFAYFPGSQNKRSVGLVGVIGVGNGDGHMVGLITAYGVLLWRAFGTREDNGSGICGRLSVFS